MIRKLKPVRRGMLSKGQLPILERGVKAVSMARSSLRLPGTTRECKSGSLAPHSVHTVYKDGKLDGGASNFQLCVATHNMNGGLNGQVGMRSVSKACMYQDWLNETHGILLLQDTRVVGEHVPGDVQDDFDDNVVRVWGLVDELHAAVAVAAHKSWQVKQKFCYPSGRALGLELQRPGLTVRVVSIYCPADMENLSVSVDNPKRRAVNDMVRAAIGWASQVEVFFVGGDFNETSNPDDRVREGRNEQKSRSEARRLGNTINSVALDPCYGLADVFYRAQIHGPKDGSTFHYRGGRSRLDYILAPCLFLQRSLRVSCETTWEFESDHAMVVSKFGIRLEEVEEKERREAKCAAKVKLNVAKASEPKLLQWRTAVIEDCEGLATELEAKLGWAAIQQAKGQGAEARAQLVRLLDKAQKDFANGAVEAAEDFWGKKPVKPKKPKSYRKQRNSIRVLRNMISEVETRVRFGSAATHNFRKRLHELRTAGLDPNIGEANWRPWELWLPWARAEISRIKYGIQVERRNLLGDRWRPKEHLFYTSAGNKKFNERYLNPKPKYMLDSVLMPSGLRDYEPKTYMNEIDKRAGRVFSKAVELPVRRGVNKVQSRPQRHDCHWGNPQKLREHFQRLDSILMSSREEKPHWWCKEYEDGKAARPEWKELMNPMTMDELVEAVKSTENGKAPGPDRLSVDMIKCLFWGRRESEATPLNIMRTAQSGCKWTWEDNPAPNAAMKVMLLLCNASIGLAEVTPGMQRGEILFIPKQTEAGTATIDVEDMRPITLLPELGKLTNRVLARRVTMTLMRHPELLDPAQRGFLKDGSTGQCVNVVLDVFEDHHERKGKKSFFTVSYDLKKAYDCVQEYSLRAALTRAGTPREFVEYVCSSLKAAKSRVRTKHGLTKGFDIKTSVRQGDPLAPLLFILLADMLHKGLRANPLYGNCNDGYRFSNQHDLVVSSVGFADDFITFSQTREGIDRMHDWVREFCGAHEMEINANKTVFVATGCAADKIPLLVNVAGNELIEPHDGNYVFRYLGVWLRVRRGNGAWTKQIAVTNACVNGMRGKIVSNRLDIIMATHVVNTVLIPQVEMAGRFVPFTVEETKQWNLKVIQSDPEGERSL